jgi:3'(2'), 5'-bisphosphate nucleotidase
MGKDIAMEDNAMVSVLEALAIAAGALIMDVRAKDIIARSKSDQSPVTEADEVAEKFILEGLARHYPEMPVVAEEAAAAGQLPLELGHQFFLVDPLDGTKEFVAGREDFTVNIALIENGVPVCGVVYAPAHSTIYSGERTTATKATVVDGQIQDRSILRAVKWSGPIRVVASRSHMNAQTEAFLNTLPECQTVQIGSSLKFCLLAEGKADIYPRFGRTMEWDTAAGDAILRATGGTQTLNGTPLPYGKRNQTSDSDFANSHFVSKSACFS